MKNEDVRKLVSFKTVEKIKPIENADAIELVCFGGWQVVVKKDEFKVGDKVIYFEIDSFLPKGIKQFAFLVEWNNPKLKQLICEQTGFMKTKSEKTDYGLTLKSKK